MLAKTVIGGDDGRDMEAVCRRLIFGFFLVVVLTGIAGSQTWNWERLTLLIILIVALFILVSVSDHYLK